jgi:hypothetical protein
MGLAPFRAGMVAVECPPLLETTAAEQYVAGNILEAKFFDQPFDLSHYTGPILAVDHTE